MLRVSNASPTASMRHTETVAGDGNEPVRHPRPSLALPPPIQPERPRRGLFSFRRATEQTPAEWLATSPADETEARIEAIRRIGELVAQDDWIVQLDLRGMGLTTIPVLPSIITHLHLQDNDLTELTKYPSCLRELYVQNNQLTKLRGGFPRRTTTVNASHNLLTRLPSFPDGGGLSSCIDIDCVGLQRLDVSHNQLSKNISLPRSLYVFRAHNNPVGFREFDHYQRLSNASSYYEDGREAACFVRAEPDPRSDLSGEPRVFLSPLLDIYPWST